MPQIWIPGGSDGPAGRGLADVRIPYLQMEPGHLQDTDFHILE